MANWDEIKREWETTKITLADLAERHDIKLGTLKSRKSREKWSRDATEKDATKTAKVATIKEDVPKDVVVYFTDDDESGLNDKQRLFIAYYVKCWNATKAYQKAYGCAYTTAMTNGNQLLRDVASGNAGNVKRSIYSLDDVTIKVVPSSRMKTVYNFTDGAVADVTTKQINMILIHPLTVITPQKYEFVSLDNPSAATGGKYLYFERKYWDLFVIAKKVDGIKINTVA